MSVADNAPLGPTGGLIYCPGGSGGGGDGVGSGGGGGSMRFSLESEFTHVTQDSRDHGAPLSYSKRYQADEKMRHIGLVDSSSVVEALHVDEAEAKASAAMAVPMYTAHAQASAAAADEGAWKEPNQLNGRLLVSFLAGGGAGEDALAMGAKVDLRRIMAASAALRVLLVAYGEWQDSHMEVRYTDVDYLVFSDAAALVASGGSPFGRSTYRYSPLLAFLLVPNSTLHPCWGKLLFSAADLLVGYFIHVILKLRGVPENLRLYSVAAWLFNPFTFTIGTRGNCEPIVCAMVLWIIICLINGHWLGLHSKMISYQISAGSEVIFGKLAHRYECKWFKGVGQEEEAKSALDRVKGLPRWHPCAQERPRPEEAPDDEWKKRLLARENAVLVLCFSQDLPFCFFTQTVAFVAFNKVITAQYFVWFFCLLPLILPWSNMKLKWEGLICILVWMGAQVHWLMWGYLLEFKGKNVFIQLWSASILFLFANVYILVMVIRYHRFTPLFVSSASGNPNRTKKMK
ncbi:hypothetical protein Taro_031434 [Colocasia esculenta]|uniref:GPI mannosyltransferase 1 n=1 Tax=Colocasia esculenta TaxID=4460 RepID=A0A843VIU3_COLES|nr:hypothetical protein [Colocasia esculenta]